MDILCLIFTQRHLVAPYKGTPFAIRIVLPRSTTIIRYAGHVCRKTHPHTEFRNERNVGGCGVIVHVNLDATIGRDGVDNSQVDPNRKCGLADDLQTIGRSLSAERLVGALV